MRACREPVHDRLLLQSRLGETVACSRVRITEPHAFCQTSPGIEVREERQGLVIGFPIGTEQRDYEGWTDDYQALSTTVYQGVEEHEGISTYHFSSSSGPKPITDPNLLAMFPESMPKGVVQALAPQLAEIGFFQQFQNGIDVILSCHVAILRFGFMFKNIIQPFGVKCNNF